MKKLVLLSLVMSIGLWSFSQERVQTPEALRNISKTVVYVTPTDEFVNTPSEINPYVSTNREIVGEDVLGTTEYDLQTNSMLGNRVHVYPDGTIGAVWTRGMNGLASPDRGTGYNYYDGNNWGPAPTERIEDVRTGWPSYAPLGENGELVVSHDFPNGLVLSSRVQKGTGEWNSSTLYGPAGNEGVAWPRMITSGDDNNTIHLLVNSYDEYEGQSKALLYYRSLDGGDTWEDEAEILDGMGEDYYTEINADDYVWAEPNGGSIAFLVAGKWQDMFMMKSTDNGDSWEKTVIWEHPYPFFEYQTTITDTFYCVDNSASITLDMDGNAHVVFGISRIGKFETGDYYTLYPFIDGVGYWNETMPMFSNNLNALAPYSNVPGSEMIEDYNLIGWTQDVNGNGEIDFITWVVEEFQTYRESGISTMPSIAVDSYGTVFLAYASTTETYDNGTTNYKHIWVRRKEATENWGAFEDLDDGIMHKFDECIYPQIGQYINPDNQSAYILYNADYEPGLALDDDHAYVENRQIMVNFNLGVGIGENVLPNFSVSQNTPNPANNNTRIMVETETTGVINLSISNLLGQVVHQQSVVSNASITTFDVNVSNMDSGIYFYTIEVGNSSVTKKMLVN